MTRLSEVEDDIVKAKNLIVVADMAVQGSDLEEPEKTGLAVLINEVETILRTVEKACEKDCESRRAEEGKPAGLADA